ncbi:MAG: hypothetical protein HQL66_12430 [Magnetococcales bacterium]|nr:hypothetical protein [Magnetococcales bacterium]
MIYDVILEMSATVTFDTLPIAVQATIQQMRGEWPAGVMPGTRVVSGRRLTHVLVDLPAADPLAMVEEAIALHQLDWRVLAMQGLDADGRLVVLRPTPPAILDYLEDIITLTGPFSPPTDPTAPPTPPTMTTSRPTQVTGLHLYEGHAPWQVAD